MNVCVWVSLCDCGLPLALFQVEFTDFPPASYFAIGLVCLYTYGGPFSWKSRRQDSVALCTSEAEYMAASEVGKEIQYLRALLHDVGSTPHPNNVYEDNLACIAISTNPVRHKSSRHIDMRVYYCRELCTAGVMKLIPLRTHLMVADALTKRVLPCSFQAP